MPFWPLVSPSVVCYRTAVAIGQPGLVPQQVPSVMSAGPFLQDGKIQFMPESRLARCGSLDFEDFFDIFARSCLLMYFLSCCHLLLRTLRLQKHARSANKCIRVGRRCFRGAPFILALGIVAHLIPPCAGMQVENTGGTLQRSSAEQPCDAFQPAGVGNVGSFPSREASAVEDDPQLLAEVFLYQASPCYQALWIDAGDSVEFVRCTLQDELFFAGNDRLLAVNPQPDRACAIFIDAPDWFFDRLAVPVLVEIQGPLVKRYMEVFTGKVDLDAIRLSVGDAWPAGGRVYVRDKLEPLILGKIVQLQPGDLVRVIPKGCSVKRCVMLDKKLKGPSRWFWHADRAESLCRDLEAERHIGLVGVMGDWSAIPAGSVSSVQELKSSISGICGRSASDFDVVAPASQPSDLFFRSARVVSLLAVVPKALDCSCTLFLDAMEFGCMLMGFVISIPPPKLLCRRTKQFAA